MAARPSSLPAVAAAPPSLEHDYLFKLLLLGDSGVGKSNLLMRFADGCFDEKMEATIGVDFRIYTVTLDNKVVKMQIWDTAGQERFRNITASYYRGSQGIIVIYDVTDRESFEHIRMWMTEIDKYAGEGAVRLLVGNKTDMVKSRCVAYDEGRALAEELNVRFIETSAKQNDNVTEAFEVLCREVKDHLNPQKQPAPVKGLRLGGAAVAGGDEWGRDAGCCQR